MSDCICGNPGWDQCACDCWNEITPADFKSLMAENRIDTVRDAQSGDITTTEVGK